MMRRSFILFLALSVSGVRAQNSPAPAPNDTLIKLANDFWDWRAKYAPFTGDDVNRIERPGGVRDWSAAAIDKRGRDLKDFELGTQPLYEAFGPTGPPEHLGETARPLDAPAACRESPRGESPGPFCASDFGPEPTAMPCRHEPS